MHQGLQVDVAARTHRDRQGQVTPLQSLIVGEGGLYIAGELHGNRRFRAFQRWLLPAQGWVVGRFAVHPGQQPMREDWYIDLDAVSVAGNHWIAEDRLLDVGVFEGQRYEIQDADELADALEQGLLSPSAMLAALRSLHELCQALERLQFSGAALLREYAPGLPDAPLW